jgi:hypothetical protein
MKSFDDRQKGFEAEFARGQELTFRITARRNRLLGLWVAERLALPAGEPAEAYAKTVVAADFQMPGDDDVVEKVRGDLTAKRRRRNRGGGAGRIDASCRASS